MKIDSSVFVDKEENALFQAGGEFYLNGGGKYVNKLRFEWVGNSKTLAEYSQKSWFSEKYSIPARELNFNAYNLTFTNQYFAFSSDIAHSKAAFSGEDVYLNAALRGGMPAGSRFPLRLSLAADGAGESYIASDGSVPGAGFRLAGKAEWLGNGNGREAAVSTTVRAAGIEEPFTSSDSKLSYKFARKEGVFSMRRAALEFGRDAADPKLISEVSSVYAQADFWILRPALRFTLAERSEAGPEDAIIIYPYPADGKTREYLKTDFEIGTFLFGMSLKGTISHKSKTKGSDELTLGASASLSGKYGRFAFRVSSPFGGNPDYSFSWRLEKKF
jgi:hypothetical protein